MKMHVVWSWEYNGWADIDGDWLWSYDPALGWVCGSL